MFKHVLYKSLVIFFVIAAAMGYQWAVNVLIAFMISILFIEIITLMLIDKVFELQPHLKDTLLNKKYKKLPPVISKIYWWGGCLILVMKGFWLFVIGWVAMKGLSFILSSKFGPANKAMNSDPKERGENLPLF